MPLTRMVHMTSPLDATLCEAALHAARDHTPSVSIPEWVARAMREKLERDRGD